jgi:purine nucleosidase
MQQKNLIPKKVIIDTDISLGLFAHDVDDGLALALALNSPELEILGITVNFGNTSPDKAIKIVKDLLKVFNKSEIPVFKGAENSKDLGKKTPAVDFILQKIKEQPVEIIGLAPFTNLATTVFLLKKEEQKNLKGFYLMGGAVWCRGNIPPLFQAEFNIFKDPLSAKIIFSSDFPVYLIGLDVTSKVVFKKDLLKIFRNSKDNTVNYLYKNIKTWFYLNYLFFRGFLLHDVLTVAVCIDKSFAIFEKFPIYVIESGLFRGKIIKLKHSKKLNNIFVAKGVDVKRFIDFFKQRIVK